MELYLTSRWEPYAWELLNMNWKSMICGRMNYRRRNMRVSFIYVRVLFIAEAFFFSEVRTNVSKTEEKNNISETGIV